MSWLKQSDASANHPLVLRVLELSWADDRLLNEAYGWINRCATQSAAFDKDYIVEIGTAKMMAGLSRYEELLKTVLYCGIFEEKEIEENGQRRAVLKLVEEEDLFHMILKSDKEREKNRRADTGDKAKKAAIIQRDGSECRWCGRIVTFMYDQKSIRKGEIDHLDPKDLDSSDPTPIERLVVACRTCNASRKAGEHWDKEIRPVPSDPYYTQDTVAWLKTAGVIGIKVSQERTELFTPEPAPALRAAKGPASTEATASDDATAISGSSTPADQDATATTGTVENHSAATAPPAQGGHSRTVSPVDMEDIDYGQMHEDLASEAVETPQQGETPAEAAEDATAPSGASAPAQVEIEPKSRKNRSIIEKAESDGSGCAGSGRDGTGGVGKRDSVHAPAEPVRPSSAPRRRNRPRRRKK